MSDRQEDEKKSIQILRRFNTKQVVLWIFTNAPLAFSHLGYTHILSRRHHIVDHKRKEMGH